MTISQVLKFEGPIDALVWKSPIEDFNTSSQLIVDETHEALLVVNGNACDLFGAGRRTLETSNIPLVSRIINIPTDGVTSFPCKVFFINMVHQMDLTWGIPGEITLNDPIYNIFLHVGMCGNLNFHISDARKFMLKMVGLRDEFHSETLVAKFRGIIKQYVKSSISKIMNVGKVSYFDMNENLFEVSEVVKAQLVPLFAEYGIEILQFYIESITVPDEDYEAVKRAKELSASRMIQGTTYQEERQLDIAEKFAGNQGSMGNIAGAVGGFMMGGAFGGNVANIARNVLNTGNSADSINQVLRNGMNQAEGSSSTGNTLPPGQFDVTGFMSGYTRSEAASGNQISGSNDGAAMNVDARYCAKCGYALSENMLFCPKCGEQQGRKCSRCGTQLMKEAKFCYMCGMQLYD